MCDLQDNARSTDTDQSPKNKTVALCQFVVTQTIVNLSTKSSHIHNKTALFPNFYYTI